MPAPNGHPAEDDLVQLIGCSRALQAPRLKWAAEVLSVSGAYSRPASPAYPEVADLPTPRTRHSAINVPMTAHSALLPSLSKATFCLHPCALVEPFHSSLQTNLEYFWHVSSAFRWRVEPCTSKPCPRTTELCGNGIWHALFRIM